LPLIFLAKDQPPSPPSVIASKKEEPFDFKKECKLLMKNKNFLRIVSCMTLTFSSYVTFLTNIDLVFKPWGYTAKDNSLFNVLLIVSGLLGSLVSAKFLDRDNPKYKLIFNSSTILGACLMALFLVTVPLHKAAFGFNLFLYGFFMIPTFSIIFPYVAELTYPCHEAVSTALMLLSCRIFATSFGLLGTILAEKGFFECSSFIIAATLIGMIPGLFISEELRKVSMKQFYTFFN
jgi:MFS family permease